MNTTTNTTSSTLATTFSTNTSTLYTSHFHNSVLGWSWGLVAYVFFASALLCWRYKRDKEDVTSFQTVLSAVLWFALMLSLVGIGVLATVLETADEFNIAATVLLAAASITFIGIGVFGTVFQWRAEVKKRTDDENEHNREMNKELARYREQQAQYQQQQMDNAKRYQESRARDETKRRYDYATLFVSIAERMLNDTQCRKAILMLETRSGDSVEFEGERVSNDAGNGDIPQLKTNRNGNVQHWDTFEVALALDSRVDNGCFWLEHQMERGYRWAYHKDMRDSMVAFAMWLSFVREVCDQNKANPPPVIENCISLLAPFSRRKVARHETLNTGDNGPRFAKLFFVWRRLLDSYPVIAKAIEPWAFSGQKRKCPHLRWWYDEIGANTKARPVLDAYFPNANVPDVQIDRIEATQFSRALMEYLWNDRQTSPPPTLSPRKAVASECKT